jgi:rod shape-determining protein MreD
VIRRSIAIVAIVITAIVLQSTVFAQMRLLGVRPELLYLVTIVIALHEGPNEGAMVGFVAGLSEDLLLNQPKGITALTLTLLGYAVGLSRHYIVSPSPLVPTVVVAIASALGIAFYEVVAFLLGQYDATLSSSIRIALLTAVYNAVLTPIVSPLLRRLMEGSRTQRVVRL